MSQLNDFLINYGFQKNDDFFSIMTMMLRNLEWQMP
ncbi:MAG: hypothetical protein Ct9H90mP6_07210 [Gammaproteobacteria bacterium]|nr:MAG: hypothetical protein Ct9H90mP6_07210 [Gammaproteobacteria bacterium]